ncbi:MAG: hypothetical protein GXO91_02635, partial [FCB group bacterium]|nr:hypothetical protein [FCB group bacterium]
MLKSIKSLSILTVFVLLTAFSYSQDVVLSYGAVDTDAGTLEVYMANTVDVYGFQFTVDNID